VTGRVTDAVTGRPVPAFTVIPLNVFRKDFVSADRYHAVPIKDGRPGVSGVVVDAGDRPVAKAEVMLATPTQIASFSRSRSEQVAVTDAAGRFTFPNPGEPCAVIAQADAGFALVPLPLEQLEAGTLRLRPWASIHGQFRDGGRLVPGARLILQPIRGRTRGEPDIYDDLQVVTNADGRFEFPRVPPVPVSVRVHLGPWKEEGFRSGPSVPLDLKPGQRAELDLGGNGATITGKVKLAGKVPADLDCSYSVNYLVHRAPGIAPPPEIAKLGFDIRNGWQDPWQLTAQGRVYMTTLEYWFVKLAPDGTFRISGVPPGEYDLLVDVYANPEGG
jgi:hypothetical protein